MGTVGAMPLTWDPAHDGSPHLLGYRVSGWWLRWRSTTSWRDASALIHHGESVRVVQSRLGHATAAETLDTYSHLWPDSEDRTRAAVETALGAREDSVRSAEAT
jgi:integrase